MNDLHKYFDSYGVNTYYLGYDLAHDLGRPWRFYHLGYAKISGNNSIHTIGIL